MREKTCGDCIHGWFSRENIAYCKGFKDRTKYVEVVRCGECKHFHHDDDRLAQHCRLFGAMMEEDDFCSCGERISNGITDHDL